MESDSSWERRVLESGGPAFHTYVPTAWGEKCDQSMLGVGGIFDDGNSSPVDSAVIDALQRGDWSPDDPLSCLYHSLQTFAIHDSGTVVPHSDAAGQDALNNAAVEIPEDLSRHVKSS